MKNLILGLSVLGSCFFSALAKEQKFDFSCQLRDRYQTYATLEFNLTGIQKIVVQDSTSNYKAIGFPSTTDLKLTVASSEIFKSSALFSYIDPEIGEKGTLYFGPLFDVDANRSVQGPTESLVLTYDLATNKGRFAVDVLSYSILGCKKQ